MHLLHRPPSGAAALLGLVLAGCTSLSGPDERTWRGVYTHAFEASIFTRCGSTTGWWASGELSAVFKAWDDAPPSEPGAARAAYVVVRGTRRGPGRFGHLGAFRYELKVAEVLEVQAELPDPTSACP